MEKRAVLLILILTIGGLAACSLPAGLIPPPVVFGSATLDLIGVFNLTETADVTPSPEKTIVLDPSETRTLTRESTTGNVVLTRTPVPGSGESVSGRCDLAKAGRPIDITVPDDTRLYPGQYFSKTWRLVNGGTCTWTTDYSVVWFSGSDLGVVRSQAFNTRVLPGSSVDVTVEMVAPMLPGTYQSNWKLFNEQGQHFGIGPNGDAPFWARIVVVPQFTPTVTPPPPTPTPTPEIVASGFSALKLSESMDLDTGQFTQLESHDLLFGQVEDEVVHLIPQNGARLVYFGSSLPNIEECRLALVAESAIRFDSLQSGTNLCYRTSQGLPGRIYLANIDIPNNLLNFEFVTWALP